MPFDSRGVYFPDLQPQAQQGWVDFPEAQPIDAGPAVNAFQQRFMGKGGDHGGNPAHAAGIAPPAMEHTEMPIEGLAHGAAKPAGAMKSL